MADRRISEDLREVVIDHLSTGSSEKGASCEGCPQEKGFSQIGENFPTLVDTGATIEYKPLPKVRSRIFEQARGLLPCGPDAPFEEGIVETIRD